MNLASASESGSDPPIGSNWKGVFTEARHKAEFEAALLEVVRMSLLLELGEVKDKVSSL